MFSVRIWSSICSAGTRAQGFFFRYSSENWTFLVRSTSSVSYGSPASSSAAWDAREQDPGLKCSFNIIRSCSSLSPVRACARVAAQGANPDIHNPDRDLPGKQPGKRGPVRRNPGAGWSENPRPSAKPAKIRSEEHTSELQSLMRKSYAVFCLKKKKYNQQIE